MKTLFALSLLILLVLCSVEAQAQASPFSGSTGRGIAWIGDTLSVAASDSVDQYNRWVFLHVSTDKDSSSQYLKVIFNADVGNYVVVRPGKSLDEKFYCRSIRFQAAADSVYADWYTTR